MAELHHILESSLVDLAANKNWHAWVNPQAPLGKSDNFQAGGEVLVPNPGVRALLLAKEDQGEEPGVLSLELILIQEPGIWPQIVIWIEARFVKTVIRPEYTAVRIFNKDNVIAEVRVETVM